MRTPWNEHSLCRRNFIKAGLKAGGVAALLAGGGLGAGMCLTGCGEAERSLPNILLITLDTTRADRLSCYGYERVTTPNLDKLARDSVLYANSLSTASSTLPAHASLFTGKFTSSHGARRHPEGPLRLTAAIPGPEHWDRYRAFPLAKEEVTLASLLKKAGYSTAGVVAGPWLKKVFGLGKGFDHYDDEGISSVNGRVAKEVTAGAVRWLQSRGKKPFFLFLNYFDPHGPYTAPEGFAARFLPEGTRFQSRKPTTAELNALYDAEILYMDHYIGKLLEVLRTQGLYEDTWIIVTADHGELMGEHGKMGHGDFLTQQEIHIPLFMKYPRKEVKPTTLKERVQLPDILPTICERLGIATSSEIQGQSLSKVKHPLVAEAYPIEISSNLGHWRALIDGDFKLLWNSEDHHALYNLKDDPGEESNLYQRDPDRAEAMMKRLEQYLTQLPKPTRSNDTEEIIDPETAESLQNLGYIK